METQVIVVGAGPAGLMLAYELTLAGVSAVVVEKRAEPSIQSRAAGLQPRTAEVLDLRGLLAPLLDGADVAEGHGGHFAGLPVPLDCSPWQTRYRGPVAVPQGRLERFLEQRLAERGGTVLRGHEVVSVSQSDSGTEIVTDTGRTLRAAFLVACDGAHSTVRKALGVPFPGRAGTARAVVADLVLATRSPEVLAFKSHFSQHIRTGGGYWTSLSPLDGGRYRFMFSSAAGQAPPRDAPIADEEIRTALQAVYGPETELAEVRAASRFSNASRQVENYRAGRVFFAGDAAHIHLPVGGQGVNLGVQDAVNLGWKLAARLNGWAPPGLLGTYHAERHPVAARVLANTRAQGILLNPAADEDMAALRALVTELMRLPQANRHLSGMMAGLDIRYEHDADDHPLTGYRMPDLDLVTEEGASRVSALTHDGNGLLLRFDHGIAVSAAGWEDRVREVPVKAADEVPAGAVLVRPDGHVCWAGSDPGGYAAALTRWFGTPADRA